MQMDYILINDDGNGSASKTRSTEMTTQTNTAAGMYCIQMTRYYYGPRTVRETLAGGNGAPIVYATREDARAEIKRAQELPLYENGEYYRTYRVVKAHN